MSVHHSPRYDWQAIELDYRAGVLSPTEVCRKHGCSLSRLVTVANKHGWVRSEAPDAALLLAASGFPATQPGWLDEGTVKKAALLSQVGVINTHRDDIHRLRELASTLTDRLGLLVAGARVGVNPDGVELPLLGKNETILGALGKLAAVTSQVIQLERQSYNLGTMTPGAESQSEMKEALDEIEARLTSLTRAKADGAGLKLVKSS